GATRDPKVPDRMFTCCTWLLEAPSSDATCSGVRSEPRLGGPRGGRIRAAKGRGGEAGCCRLPAPSLREEAPAARSWRGPRGARGEGEAPASPAGAGGGGGASDLWGRRRPRAGGRADLTARAAPRPAGTRRARPRAPGSPAGPPWPRRRAAPGP
ncbi:unnamed protein product, partial [Prorocentrum cordatum]